MVPPRILQTDWAYLRVVYLAPSAEEGFLVETWETRDPVLLEKLRGACQISNRHSSGVISMRRDNRLDLELSDGQRWVMAYHQRPRHLAMYDPDMHKRSYWYELEPEFIEALERAIKKDTGTEVTLVRRLEWSDVHAMTEDSSIHDKW